MVTLPMTFLSNTPLDCTIHHSLWPSNFTSKATKIPSHTRFVQSYAKKYCSEAYISPFLLYLPFTLLLAPMVLTACEKIFIGSVTWAAYLLNNIFTFRIFKTEKRLEQFYSLLIKESLDREDVNSLEKENVRWLHRHQSVLAGNAKIWYFLVIYTRSDKLSGIAARATSPTYTGNNDRPLATPSRLYYIYQETHHGQNNDRLKNQTNATTRLQFELALYL